MDNDQARALLLLDAARRAPSRPRCQTRRLLLGYADPSLGYVERVRWFTVLVNAVAMLRWRDATPTQIDDARERAEMATAILVVGLPVAS